MVSRKKEMFDQTNTITKVVSFIDEGLLEQVRYYSGDEEISRELYDEKGILLRRSGKIPDGLVKEYYGDGAVRRTIDFKNGIAHGKGIDYYPSGEVFEESCFSQGQLHGLNKLYRRDGALWTEAVYRHGRLHGVVASYHDNGNTEARAEYKNGNLDGSYTKYDKYGNLLEEGNFNQGEKEGNYTSYHETGQVARVERYIRGKLVYCEEFDENGRIIAVIESGQTKGGR